jgi:hypothetical protein
MLYAKFRTYTILLQNYAKQAEVIQNHENVNARNIGQDEAQHRKYKRFRLGGGQAYEGVSRSFRTDSITKYTLTTINTR